MPEYKHLSEETSPYLLIDDLWEGFEDIRTRARWWQDMPDLVKKELGIDISYVDDCFWDDRRLIFSSEHDKFIFILKYA
jgi:hypothetical protein